MADCGNRCCRMPAALRRYVPARFAGAAAGRGRDDRHRSDDRPGALHRRDESAAAHRSSVDPGDHVVWRRTRVCALSGEAFVSAPLRITIDVFLCITAVTCWLGVLGMWRMRQPMQALHYMALPAALGS